MANASLYDRLGGEEKILAIVVDLLALHHQNPVIATRYDNAKKSDAEIVDLVVDLLGSATGGPQEYQGLDMETAHKGMNCSEAEFVAGALILPASADQEREGLFEYFEQDGRWALLALAAYAALSMWVNWFLFATTPISTTGAWVVTFGGLALAAFMSSNQRILGVLTAGHLLIAIYAYFAFAPMQY